MNNEFYGSESLYLGGFRSVRAFRTTEIQVEETLYSLNSTFSFKVGEERVASCGLILYHLGDGKFSKNIFPFTGADIKFLEISGLPAINELPSNHLILAKFKMDLRSRHIESFIGPFSQDWWYHNKNNFMMRHTASPPPQNDCSCGFYSFYEVPIYGNEYAYDVYQYRWGVVENYGRVIHGTLGVRSERVKLLGVSSYDGLSELITQFPLSKYEVPKNHVA